jgi:hypothetical protein
MFVEQFDESKWFEKQPPGAKQVAEKGICGSGRLAGAKSPRLILRLFGPAKAVPLLQSMSNLAVRGSFSAACKAHPFCDLYGIRRGGKSCPDTKPASFSLTNFSLRALALLAQKPRVQPDRRVFH